ncbi:hypothetical protein, partial [Burkholderia gladioli]|uniref:hypothetical protein n=1 Tax=Burkholderia gladioli TaxID=28095 RepID=UPI0006272DE5
SEPTLVEVDDDNEATLLLAVDNPLEIEVTPDESEVTELLVLDRPDDKEVTELLAVDKPLESEPTLVEVDDDNEAT